jgi:hypothetical protein
LNQSAEGDAEHDKRNADRETETAAHSDGEPECHNDPGCEQHDPTIGRVNGHGCVDTTTRRE